MPDSYGKRLGAGNYFLALAQRFLAAAAILARASGLITRLAFGAFEAFDAAAGF